ncbi:hypothetical protein [Bradyrhizobium ivorense]|uniref:hypothetical protein n=1 Tax=Bradyrhizobium ivorense TaxID=2511166 RepID=UPI001116FD08|nr:hypothetical protein [Bradyrhizobium ivorense]
MLAPLLGVSAATSALCADISDLDVSGPVGSTSSRPLWDVPASSAPAIDAAPASPSPIGGQGAMNGNPLWTIPLAVLPDTRQRPIFSPSRRPPPPAAALASEPKLPPPPPIVPPVELQLSLVGTISGGDLSFGIFVDKTSKATLRLKIGEDYQGWRLRSVHGREAIMAYGERSETLNFPTQAEAAVAISRTVAESAPRRGSSHSPEYD